MTIQKLILPIILLSTSAFATSPQSPTSPSELIWSTGDNTCMGKICVKLDEKKPDVSDKIDKFEQRNLKEPPAFRNDESTSSQKTLRFSFDDD